MKANFILMVLSIGTIGCSQNNRESSEFLTSSGLTRQEYKDSIERSIVMSVNIDTVGLSKSPIVINSTKVENSSGARSVVISYVNVSEKSVKAIRFKWFGLNAFNEPFHSNSYTDGIEFGETEYGARPKEGNMSKWRTSNDLSKLILAWPIQVVFTDDTQWKLGKQH